MPSNIAKTHNPLAWQQSSDGCQHKLLMRRLSRSPGMARRRRNLGALFVRQPVKTFEGHPLGAPCWASFDWGTVWEGSGAIRSIFSCSPGFILAFRFDGCMPCQSHSPFLHGNQFLLRPSSPLSATPLFHNRDCLTYSKYRQVIRNRFWWCTFPAVKPCSGGSQIPMEHGFEIGLEIGQLVFHRSTLHPQGWRPMQLIKQAQLQDSPNSLLSLVPSLQPSPDAYTHHTTPAPNTSLPD